MSSNIGGLQVRNTADNLTPDKRFCTFIYSRPKTGKTRMVGTLDALTKKHFGKPTLIIACEPSDGGGTDSLIEMGVDYIQPSSLQEIKTVMSQLQTDTKYGGIAIDSLTEVAKRFLLPYSVQNLPARMANKARADFGTPVADDYQNAGELLRQILNQLVGLSSTPKVENRKHVVGTAISKYKFDWSKGGGGQLLDVLPDVPGGMSETVNAIFQTIGTISLVRDKGSVLYKFVTSTNEGGFGKFSSLGDRYGIPTVVGADFVEIYEQHWLPRIKK